MAAVKDYTVFCVDVSPNMDQLDRNGASHLSTSLKVINLLVQQKMFAGSKDEFAVVLCGTDDTNNPLAESEGGYENISVVREMALPDLDLLHSLEHEIKSQQYADFIDALVVSMDLIAKSVDGKKKVGDLRIFLFTDAASEHSDDCLGEICAGLKKLNIQLLIIGPDDGDDGDGGGGGGGGDGGDNGDGHHDDLYKSGVCGKKSSQQADGERMLRSITSQVNGVIFSFEEALKSVSFIQTRAKKQTARFTGHVEIGSKLKISCKMYTKMMSEKVPTWKKMSAISQTSANPDTMAVHMERSYHKQDDEETEVDLEDVAKGYRYGKSLIPISNTDEEAMKLETERCLQVLGFTHNDNVGLHLHLGTSVLVVVGTPGDEGAGRAMSSLVRALHETECCAIARYVWRAKAQPKLVVLKPFIKMDYECLLLIQLPFNEDVRSYYFPSLVSTDKTKPTGDQLEAVDHLITSMDLMKASHDEVGKTTEAFKPKQMFNPVLQRLYQCIRHRSLHPDQLLPDLDPVIADCLQPPPNIVRQSTGPLQRINDIFPLVEISNKKGKEKKTAADVWSERQRDVDGQPPSKQPHLNPTNIDETDFSMAGLTRGVVVEVGTLDPVKDYVMLLDKDDGSGFERISQQLQGVITKLVKESFGDTYYDKATNCVRTLRQQSIKNQKPKVFNSFLLELKDDLIGTRYSPFWTKLVESSIGLITHSECVESDVTGVDDLKLGVDSNIDTVTDHPLQDDQEDADDLLEMM